jgi:group I intron endonuclease
MSIKSRFCGIYSITNTVNGKKYVGSSIDITDRWAAHKQLAKNGKHPNLHLCRAIQKYGIDSFKFDILEVVLNPTDLLKIESMYLEWMEPEYNIAKDTLAPMLGRHHSIEARAKISAAGKGRKHSAETCIKYSVSKMGEKNPCFGKHLSDEHKAKISSANKGRGGFSLSVETKAKISVAKKGRNNPHPGYSRTAETRAKIGAAQKGRKRPVETGIRISAALKGKKHSEETRTKMRAAWARRKAAQGKANTPEATI